MSARTGIDLLALYKSLGFTQRSACEFLGIGDVDKLRKQVKGKSVIHPWEWEKLDGLARKRDMEVNRLLDSVKDQQEVTLPVWTGNMWEADFKNQVVSLVAWTLEGEGVTIHYRLGDFIVRKE